MSSCRCQVPVVSLEIVTFGAVQAVADDVADGVGVADGASELEEVAVEEAPAGSTVRGRRRQGGELRSGSVQG